MIDPIHGLSQVSSAAQVQQNAGHPEKFGDAFKRELDKAQTQADASADSDKSVQPAFLPNIEFSKHAIMRAVERGIEVTPELVDQLADSVERAQAKGATNILAFDATRAFIINVPNSKVITTISQDEMRENIFTNIDGAVLL